MKMAAKSGTRAKATVKPAKTVSKAATATKPVKKTVKKRTAALPAPLKKAVARAAAAGRPFTRAEVELLKRGFVPLDEVEALAARAVRLIKASKKLSAADKAWNLNDVADTLEKARGWGGISKAGALLLSHEHLPPGPISNIRAVLK
jgi:hypothetical protein